MNKYKKWQYQKIAEEMVVILKDKGYEAFYAEDTEAAKELILQTIEKGKSVAMGGSETLAAMELVKVFREGDYQFFDRYQKLPHSEIVEIYRQSMLADYLVTGTNAVTRNGELVNVDSSGNRVAGMIFGPRKVIVVVGANKVVDDLDEAFTRLRKISPMNSLRNNHKTPCVETGRCEDCQTPNRTCNFTGIIHNGRKYGGRIMVIMIADEAGF